ncbi:Dual-specificity RNA methyltransferase RlmN [Streptomyces alboniger]
MDQLPAGTREKLREALLPDLMSVVRHVGCDDDTTRKTLWRLFDGTLVESVPMRYPDRVTMYISSQAGCGMNCAFCATGQGRPRPEPVDGRDRAPDRGRHARPAGR